jgi:hypothetical protein
MRARADLAAIIERRLKKYLSRDKTGIRREMLRLFTRSRSLSIGQVFEEITRRFTISYHSVAAMVGIIASRIGILHIIRDRDGSASVYQLKDRYHDMVVRVVGI